MVFMYFLTVFSLVKLGMIQNESTIGNATFGSLPILDESISERLSNGNEIRPFEPEVLISVGYLESQRSNNVANKENIMTDLSPDQLIENNDNFYISSAQNPFQTRRTKKSEKDFQKRIYKQTSLDSRMVECLRNLSAVDSNSPENENLQEFTDMKDCQKISQTNECSDSLQNHVGKPSIKSPAIDFEESCGQSKITSNKEDSIQPVDSKNMNPQKNTQTSSGSDHILVQSNRISTGSSELLTEQDQTEKVSGSVKTDFESSFTNPNNENFFLSTSNPDYEGASGRGTCNYYEILSRSKDEKERLEALKFYLCNLFSYDNLIDDLQKTGDVNTIIERDDIFLNGDFAENSEIARLLIDWYDKIRLSDRFKDIPRNLYIELAHSIPECKDLSVIHRVYHVTNGIEGIYFFVIDPNTTNELYKTSLIDDNYSDNPQPFIVMTGDFEGDFLCFDDNLEKSSFLKNVSNICKNTEKLECEIPQNFFSPRNRENSKTPTDNASNHVRQELERPFGLKKGVIITKKSIYFGEIDKIYLDIHGKKVPIKFAYEGSISDNGIVVASYKDVLLKEHDETGESDF